MASPPAGRGFHTLLASEWLQVSATSAQESLHCALLVSPDGGAPWCYRLPLTAGRAACLRKQACACSGSCLSHERRRKCMQLPLCFCMRFVPQGKRRCSALQPEWPFRENSAVPAAAPAFRLSRTTNACMNSHRRACELCPALQRERPVGENRAVPTAAAAYHLSGNQSACNY